jgi:uncharacterized membrane protein
MSEETTTSTPEPAAPAPDTQDIENGKTFAILCYVLSFIGLPFFIVPLIQQNNGFALFHAKQVMLLWLAGIALGIAGVLTLICIGPIVAILGVIGLLVLSIVGLVSALKGETKPVPLIGKFAEEWFKGIQKKA